MAIECPFCAGSNGTTNPVVEGLVDESEVELFTMVQPRLVLTSGMGLIVEGRKELVSLVIFSKVVAVDRRRWDVFEARKARNDRGHSMTRAKTTTYIPLANRCERGERNVRGLGSLTLSS